MIAPGARAHHGSKLVDMIDRLPRLAMIGRVLCRNYATNRIVADIETVGMLEYMTRMYSSHQLRSC
jgi:hypothetical protein